MYKQDRMNLPNVLKHWREKYTYFLAQQYDRYANQTPNNQVTVNIFWIKTLSVCFLRNFGRPKNPRNQNIGNWTELPSTGSFRNAIMEAGLSVSYRINCPLVLPNTIQLQSLSLSLKTSPFISPETILLGIKRQRGLIGYFSRKLVFLFTLVGFF